MFLKSLMFHFCNVTAHKKRNGKKRIIPLFIPYCYVVTLFSYFLRYIYILYNKRLKYKKCSKVKIKCNSNTDGPLCGKWNEDTEA